MHLKCRGKKGRGPADPFIFYWIYWHLLEFIGIYWHLLEFIGFIGFIGVKKIVAPGGGGLRFPPNVDPRTPLHLQGWTAWASHPSHEWNEPGAVRTVR